MVTIHQCKKVKVIQIGNPLSIVRCLWSVHITFTFHSHSIQYEMQAHPGGNKSLLHILPVVYVSLLESDVYSDFMYAYMHKYVIK